MVRAFPFRTFDEIAALGFEVTVYCSRCFRTIGPIDLGDERLRGKAFTDVRFVCSRLRGFGTAHPPQSCGSPGHVIIGPTPADRIPPHRSIAWCSIQCPRCVPTWEISQAAKHLPPWDKIWTSLDVRLACPACRTPLTTSWCGGNGIPHTDGYRRETSAR